MIKKTRTILFFICLFLFLIFAPSAVFYSQGYRFDFNSKKIVKTGAFSFKVWPKNAEIYLNSKFKKKTDLFFGSAWFENLSPKKYQIQIKKAGFLSWEKNLEIKESEVTEARNIFLIPENPKFEILVEKTEDFFFSPDGKKIILKRVNEDTWSLEFFDLEKDKKEGLFEETKENELLNLIFSPDSKKILLKIREKKRVKNLIIEVEKRPINLISLDFLGKDIEKISFNPKELQKIFFIKENSLFEADFLKKEVNFEPILKNLTIFEISNENFYWLSKDGFLFKTDFSGKIEEKINSKPFFLKEEKNYQIFIKEPRIFLKENDILYLLDLDLKNFQKFFEPVKGIEFSPDGKKMTYFNDYESWVLFLEDIYDQPQKKALDQLFLTRFSEKIDRVFWYTSYYLIFNTGPKMTSGQEASGRIKIVEIDDRDKINLYDLAEFKLLKIFFNQFDKKVYILSEGNLFFSEKLLP